MKKILWPSIYHHTAGLRSLQILFEAICVTSTIYDMDANLS